MAKHAAPKGRKKVAAGGKSEADVFFASAFVERLEAKATLPSKFMRVLDRLPLARICDGAVVALKVHVGLNIGFTTIPPLFVRMLVQRIKDAGAKSVFVTDGSLSIQEATARGYTAEVLGAPLLGAAGVRDKFFYRHKVGYKTLKEVEVCGNIEDADALINLSHFKGHGACGYGGALKNLAMGCVTQTSRGNLHQLEGGLVYNKSLCIKCKRCVEACTHGAAKWNAEKDCLEIFYHDCLYCRHCVMACPKDAFKIAGGGFIPFQHGMALAAREVLGTFEPGRALHINFLTQITLYCDCWGFSTPALIPDVGILAGEDLVAVDKASLDLTADGVPLPGSLPSGRELVEGKHMFQRIHGKDPYSQIEQMEAAGLGTAKYRLQEIR
ncbi:MAG: DUF362 domain-containing protein [Planctomycetota bacterium]|nr:DUF362 domain-containing protein [Planctomycetota bacterium]